MDLIHAFVLDNGQDTWIRFLFVYHICRIQMIIIIAFATGQEREGHQGQD